MMAKYNLGDTIAAISTPVGESGIGIVRLSGKDAIKIADKIFVSNDGKKPSGFKTYTVHYGWIRNSHQVTLPVRQAGKSPSHTSRINTVEHEIIDEVILTVMRAPKSYTKEDIVEINGHGGIVALRSILDLVLAYGCRIAGPGEFTKRAFLNGRIDLAQAEAVLDVIRAKTDAALKMGIGQLKGELSAQLNAARKILLEILSLLEANIDFPEEEISAPDLEKISENIRKVNNQLRDILEASRHGQVLREGISVVICGKPNVGKSSLLNALLKQERSIVTAVAGTTRDTIEETIDIKGIPLRIVDTAGILEPRDLIEKKAVARSKKYIDSADLVILLFDASRRLTREDEFLMHRLKKKTVIAVINKVDLKQKICRKEVVKSFKQVVEISAKKMKNINLLEEAIVDLVYSGMVSNPESIMMSNLRHIGAARRAQKLLDEAGGSLDNKLSLEFVAQDIKEALLYLDDILGRRFQEDLLDKIFREFCIGK